MRKLTPIPVLLAALIAATACGGSPSAPPVTGGSPAGAGGSQQRFASCMRDHGQDVPDPDPGSGEVALTPPPAADRGAWDAAMRACQQYLPGGGQQPPPDPQELETLRQYAACMREHGVEMTDPDPSTGRSQFGGRLAHANRDQIQDDPTYQAAQAACQDTLTGPTPSKGARP